MVVGCSYERLRNFTMTATGIQTFGPNSLIQVSGQSDLLANGSYIGFSCVSGFVNTGGNLNVTCQSSGSWTQFPNCVSTSGAACSIALSSTFNVTNGFPLSMALTYVSNTTATGN